MHSKKILYTALAAGLLVLTGCASKHPLETPLGQSSFQEYLAETRAWIAENRHFVMDDHEKELTYHTPFEIRPAGKTDKGILLIHGLGDSPWTYRDLATKLAEQGMLVRTVLLPGHGTKPADMIGVTSEDWNKAVQEQIDLLKKEVPNVWLGGFSTGGNLAFSQAAEDPDIRGLILFSPAIEIRTKLVELVPFADLFIDWLRKPDKNTEGVLPFKYGTIPLDGLNAFKDTMDDADKALKKKPYDKPVLVMMSANDSIVDTQSLLKIFDKQLTNPNSKIIWYGELPKSKISLSSRIVAKKTFLPSERIETFSHMALTYSPENEWYGRNGKYRYCVNRSTKGYYEKCMAAPEVWYGAYGTVDGDRLFARLTYNPYFFRQLDDIEKVIAAGTTELQPNLILEKVTPIKASH